MGAPSEGDARAIGNLLSNRRAYTFRQKIQTNWKKTEAFAKTKNKESQFSEKALQKKQESTPTPAIYALFGLDTPTSVAEA